jgi:hypothetical protein
MMPPQDPHVALGMAEHLFLRAIREGTKAERLEAEAAYLAAYDRVYKLPKKASPVKQGKAPALPKKGPAW